MRKLNQNEIDYILFAWKEQNLTQSKIAEVLGITQAGIHKVLKRHGMIQDRNRNKRSSKRLDVWNDKEWLYSMYKTEHTHSMTLLAKELHCSVDLVSKILHKHYPELFEVHYNVNQHSFRCGKDNEGTVTHKVRTKQMQAFRDMKAELERRNKMKAEAEQQRIEIREAINYAYDSGNGGELKELKENFLYEFMLWEQEKFGITHYN